MGEDLGLEDLLNVLKTPGYPKELYDIIEKIKDVASDMEKTILDGKKLDLGKEGPMGKIVLFVMDYYSAVKEHALYERSIIEWSILQLAEMAKNAAKQRTLFEFYENAPEANHCSSAVFGTPEKPKLKIFTKEMNDFYVRMIEFPALKTRLYDIPNHIDIDATIYLEEGKIEKWNANYKDLVKRINEESKDYSILLMKSAKNISARDTTIAIMDFLNEFVKYHSEKH